MPRTNPSRGEDPGGHASPPTQDADQPQGRCPASLGLDLQFQDKALEAVYVRRHNESQVHLDLALAAGIRLIGWAGTAIKTWQRGDPTTAMTVLTICLPSGIFPLLGMCFGRRFYVRHRAAFVFMANLMQFWLVPAFYSTLYPYTCAGDCSDASESVPVIKAFSALLAGNGVAFLVITTIMGALTFRWLFITQFVYFMELMLSNRKMCAQSIPLRQATVWIFGGAAKLLGLKRLFRLGDAVGSSGTPTPMEVCIHSQVTLQLVLGFWIPCWFAYTREIHARRLFATLVGLEFGPGSPAPRDMVAYCAPALFFPWVVYTWWNLMP